MEMKVTKERVQEAAKSCPDAARVLKTLFPEAFEGSKSLLNIPAGTDPWRQLLLLPTRDGRQVAIARREGGPYNGSLFLSTLPDDTEWAIVDDNGCKVLIIRKKA